MGEGASALHKLENNRSFGPGRIRPKIPDNPMSSRPRTRPDPPACVIQIIQSQPDGLRLDLDDSYRARDGTLGARQEQPHLDVIEVEECLCRAPVCTILGARGLQILQAGVAPWKTMTGPSVNTASYEL